MWGPAGHGNHAAFPPGAMTAQDRESALPLLRPGVCLTGQVRPAGARGAFMGPEHARGAGRGRPPPSAARGRQAAPAAGSSPARPPPGAPRGAEGASGARGSAPARAELATRGREQAPWAGPAALHSGAAVRIPASPSPSPATMEAQAQGEWARVAPRVGSPARRGGASPASPNFSDRAERRQPRGPATPLPRASAGWSPRPQTRGVRWGRGRRSGR